MDIKIALQTSDALQLRGLRVSRRDQDDVPLGCPTSDLSSLHIGVATNHTQFCHAHLHQYLVPRRYTAHVPHNSTLEDSHVCCLLILRPWLLAFHVLLPQTFVHSSKNSNDRTEGHHRLSNSLGDDPARHESLLFAPCGACRIPNSCTINTTAAHMNILGSVTASFCAKASFTRQAAR